MRQLKISKTYTVRDTYSIAKYLTDIGPEGRITQEEEVSLAHKIRHEDCQESKDKLIRANLRFVVSVAKQYVNINNGHAMELSDLISEGNIGLIKAAERFDETKGFKFISFAVWWIRQSILDYKIKHDKQVRLPLNKITTLNQIHKAQNKFEQIYYRDPTNAEIAEMLNCDEDIVKEVRMLGLRETSLCESPVNTDDAPLYQSMSDEDCLWPDDDLLFQSLSSDIERCFAVLHGKEAYIIRNFYGIGCKQKTISEIGCDIKISKERVRQIKDRAIRRLKGNKSILKLWRQHLSNKGK